MRYRPKDGDDKRLEADFSQTIAQDFQIESWISLKRPPTQLRFFAQGRLRGRPLIAGIVVLRRAVAAACNIGHFHHRPRAGPQVLVS
jgi:hypothetical protein